MIWAMTREGREAPYAPRGRRARCTVLGAPVPAVDRRLLSSDEALLSVRGAGDCLTFVTALTTHRTQTSCILEVGIATTVAGAPLRALETPLDSPCAGPHLHGQLCH